MMNLNDHNWQEAVTRSDTPVVVCFTAAWCGACQQFKPTLERLAATLDGKAGVGAVDTDANRSLTRLHGIRYLPTVVIYKGGVEAHRVVGGRSEAYFLDQLRRLGVQCDAPADYQGEPDWPSEPLPNDDPHGPCEYIPIDTPPE